MDCFNLVPREDQLIRPCAGLSAMEGPTQFIEIPGYADAIRREDSLRRAAWVHEAENIAGVPVRRLTWRDVETLAAMRNGFFCPWKFETDEEFVGHCAQLVWWLSDCAKPARGAGFVSLAICRAQKHRLIKYLAAKPEQLATDVTRYLADSFLDAPKGHGAGSSKGAIAGGPAYIADTLAWGGYAMTMDQLLDMPIVQLWQILRVCRQRLTGESPINESDILASQHLEKINGGKN